MWRDASERRIYEDSYEVGRNVILCPSRRAVTRRLKMADGSKTMSIPSVGIEKYTVIFNLSSNKPLLRIDGVLVLPVGSEIELPVPQSKNLRVERVRLLTPASPSEGVAVCLDVRLEDIQ